MLASTVEVVSFWNFCLNYSLSALFLPLLPRKRGMGLQGLLWNLEKGNNLRACAFWGKIVLELKK